MARAPGAHRVVVVAMEDVIVGDLVLAPEVLGRVPTPDGRTPYEVRVASERPRIDAGAFEMRVPHRLEALATADTIVVPGRREPLRRTPVAVLQALQAAHRRGVRLISICVGAFVLAEAGLLDGRRATTHWAAADQLAARHPDVEVDPNVLFVDNGQVLTSAGAAAGFDVLLHVVERDHGLAVAAATAKALVLPLARPGGQAQFIDTPVRRTDDEGLAPVLEWLEANLDRPLALDDIAAHAAMSTRTLNRRFREHTGSSPARWLCRARIRRARWLLESTDETVEAIAYQVGFGSPVTFREHFVRQVGASPRRYRSTFRAVGAAGSDGSRAGTARGAGGR